MRQRQTKPIEEAFLLPVAHQQKAIAGIKHDAENQQNRMAKKGYRREKRDKSADMNQTADQADH